jgi:hypothetical protein
MEEFYQHFHSSKDFLKRKQDQLFVYSSPHENGMDRCGEIQNGQYFACSELLVRKNEVWMKIRRGFFSNTKRNGYIRVYYDFNSTTSINHTSNNYYYNNKEPVPFQHLIQLPSKYHRNFVN